MSRWGGGGGAEMRREGRGEPTVVKRDFRLFVCLFLCFCLFVCVFVFLFFFLCLKKYLKNVCLVACCCFVFNFVFVCFGLCLLVCVLLLLFGGDGTDGKTAIVSHFDVSRTRSLIVLHEGSGCKEPRRI